MNTISSPSAITNGMPLKGVRGQMLSFKDDPFLKPASECYDHYQDGLIVIRDGKSSMRETTPCRAKISSAQ